MLQLSGKYVVEEIISEQSKKHLLALKVGDIIKISIGFKCSSEFIIELLGGDILLIPTHYQLLRYLAGFKLKDYEENSYECSGVTDKRVEFNDWYTQPTC